MQCEVFLKEQFTHKRPVTNSIAMFQITLGRATKDKQIDVDLSLEGPAWKISRKQGHYSWHSWLNCTVLSFVCMCSVLLPDAKYYAKYSFAPLNLYSSFTKLSQRHFSYFFKREGIMFLSDLMTTFQHILNCPSVSHDHWLYITASHLGLLLVCQMFLYTDCYPCKTSAMSVKRGFQFSP